MDWLIPEAFLAMAQPDPDKVVWLGSVGLIAEQLCEDWRLVLDGPVMTGHMSLVWPVRDEDGRPLALKVVYQERATVGEVPALRAAAGPQMVELVADDEGGAALLLERLDATRMLEDVEIDEACAVIGQIVLDVSAVSAPAGVLRAKDELERITTSIRAQWAGVGSVVPEMLAEQALATLADLITNLGAAESTPLPLVHGDLHFRNVLHTLPETEPSAWKAIDPFPFAGLPELDVIAALRNRWTDAQTTGNVDRALRRRVDMICEPAGLDRRLARAAAQAVAVDNLLWLLPDRPEHMFVAPYSVVAEWGN